MLVHLMYKQIQVYVPHVHEETDPTRIEPGIVKESTASYGATKKELKEIVHKT